MSAKRKQITFDIDTNICKQIFGNDKFRRPYKDIRKFFEENDWIHIEGSMYISFFSNILFMFSNILWH